MKICTKCKEGKPFIMFSKHTRKPDGLRIWCKACDAVYAAANKERYAAHRAANKESCSEYHKARYAANPDVKKTASRERYATKKDEILPKQAAYGRVYHAKYPERGRATAAKRRALLANATPPWVNYAEIAAFYEDAKTLETIFGWPFHVDHIVPLNHPLVSGLHVPANLQILNASDNLSKSNTFEI